MRRTENPRGFEIRSEPLSLPPKRVGKIHENIQDTFDERFARGGRSDSRRGGRPHGDRVSGKTTLIRAVCDRLGVTDTVTSPTFAIVNEYRGDGTPPVYHFDFYRIDRIEEAFDFGYEEYFFSGNLCLVEWPEKIESLLPDDAMNVRIDVPDEDERVISID